MKEDFFFKHSSWKNKARMCSQEALGVWGFVMDIESECLPWDRDRYGNQGKMKEAHWKQGGNQQRRQWNIEICMSAIPPIYTFNRPPSVITTSFSMKPSPFPFSILNRLFSLQLPSLPASTPRLMACSHWTAEGTSSFIFSIPITRWYYSPSRWSSNWLVPLSMEYISFNCTLWRAVPQVHHSWSGSHLHPTLLVFLLWTLTPAVGTLFLHLACPVSC